MCKPSEIEDLFTGNTKYLSIHQISKKLKTTDADVSIQIKNCENVYESFVLPIDGSLVYTSRKKVNRLQDIWNAFRHLSYLKATA